MTPEIKVQRRTVIGACEYSIATLQDIKKHMIDSSSPRHDVMWSVGGIVVTLTANLIKIADEVFQDSIKIGTADAKRDLNEIKGRMGQFISQMVGE